MDRARLAKVAAGLAFLGAAVVAASSEGAGGATVPVVSLPTTQINRVEGGAGASTVILTAGLSEASTTAVHVAYATVPASAKATDGDYLAQRGTLTFPPGVVSQPITVQVNGDTRLEDHEIFRVKLSKPVGATLGSAKEKIQILNDELPNVVVSPVTVYPSRVAVFRAKLGRRFYQALTLNARTVNGSATAPTDFTAVSTSVTFAAGAKGPIRVKVPTLANPTSEPNETFSVQMSTAGGVLGTGMATIMGGSGTPPPNAACPTGSTPTTPQPAAPSSPSSPATLLPPSAVTGGAQWDLMFNDEFGDAAYTASSWSTGMRSGELTLEGNAELQWYLPANSVLTTDNDGFGTASVLRQTLQQQVVPGERYTVRTLSRVYPPSTCSSYYDPNVNNSTSSSNTNPTKVPYQFTSGMINNAKSFGFKYGYVETRVKMPKGFALWPALWLRDWRGWNYEIDAFEGFDRQARVFRTTYWWGNGNSRSTENDGGDIGVSSGGVPCRQYVPVPAATANASACSLGNGVDLSAGYHTIGLSWTATKYELYLDGVKRWTSPAGADVARYYSSLILNLALGNNGFEFDWTGEPVKPLDANLFSSSYFPKRTVEWDYVRVWQAATAHDTCAPPNCN